MAGAEDKKPLPLNEMGQLSDYIGERLDLEDVDCSNILPFIKSYLQLSTANQLYLTVFANRFLDQVYEAKEPTPAGGSAKGSTNPATSEDPYTCMGSDVNLKEDIACAVELIGENEITLSDQAYIIETVLPKCLNPTG